MMYIYTSALTLPQGFASTGPPGDVLHIIVQDTTLRIAVGYAEGVREFVRSQCMAREHLWLYFTIHYRTPDLYEMRTGEDREFSLLGSMPSIARHFPHASSYRYMELTALSRPCVAKWLRTTNKRAEELHLIFTAPNLLVLRQVTKKRDGSLLTQIEQYIHLRPDLSDETGLF